MANKRFSDVNPCHKEKDADKRAQYPNKSGTPQGVSFEKHPRHTGPTVKGPGEYPKV